MQKAEEKPDNRSGVFRERFEELRLVFDQILCKILVVKIFNAVFSLGDLAGKSATIIDIHRSFPRDAANLRKVVDDLFVQFFREEIYCGIELRLHLHPLTSSR